MGKHTFKISSISREVTVVFGEESVSFRQLVMFFLPPSHVFVIVSLRYSSLTASLFIYSSVLKTSETTNYYQTNSETSGHSYFGRNFIFLSNTQAKRKFWCEKKASCEPCNSLPNGSSLPHLFNFTKYLCCVFKFPWYTGRLGNGRKACGDEVSGLARQWAAGAWEGWPMGETSWNKPDKLPLAQAYGLISLQLSPRSPKGNVFNFQIPPRAKENSSKTAINVERVLSDLGKHSIGFKMKYPVTNLM